MGSSAVTSRTVWLKAGAALLAVALAQAVVEALGGGLGATAVSLAVGASVVGAGLLAFGWTRRPGSDWAVVAAAVPVCYLVMSTAPLAVTREAPEVLRLVVSVAALLVYTRAAGPLAGLRPYGVCCGCLGVAAAFFVLWEPPPPRPVPIARHLADLETQLPAMLTALKDDKQAPPWWPGWTGKHTRLTEAIEKVLGADEYLNLGLVSSDGRYRVLVFVTYNADAMTNIPHVPWVCMTQSGFRLVSIRQDDMQHPTAVGKEVKPNVILFEPGDGMGNQNALMFQYFNVGGVYESNRQLARILATSGAIGKRGSYLSQTQVAVWFAPTAEEDPMSKTSRPYQIGLQILRGLVPLLEKEYYPDLAGGSGSRAAPLPPASRSAPASSP